MIDDGPLPLKWGVERGPRKWHKGRMVEASEPNQESVAPSAARTWRAMVVEDDPVLRSALTGIVSSDPLLQCVGSGGSVAEGMALLDHAPDIVLLDLGLPDGSGVEIINELRNRGPGCKVLVITVFEDRASVTRTLRAGADGYILKDTAQDDILAHIHSTLANETPISARAATHLLSIVRDEEPDDVSPAKAILTPRERQVLELMSRGLSRKESARAMDLSPFTVAEYVQSIYRKLQVRSRGEAVYEAINSRLITIGGRPE